jgi:benzoyl-CoA reductase/2-hydroxyglutaryl-CoA dehydratase subunit BcrC/BadD/HgdB
MNNRYAFFADVILPAKLNTQSARTYMRDVLTRFKADLERAAGRAITPDDLKKSIQTVNLIRKNLSRIYALRSTFPGLIRGTDLHALVKGSMIMDRDELTRLLPKVADKLEQQTVPDTGGKRIVLSGSICDFPDIYTAIESAGGTVAGDDLCTGQRWFEQEISDNEEPLAAIASRYMDRLICPAKHVSVTARGESIVGLAQKNRADGVIFMLMKFCDPHAFDIPFLTDFLDRQGIKSMVVEMDDQQQAQGRISTRIETFIHMI